MNAKNFVEVLSYLDIQERNMVLPASLFSRDWSSSDTLRKTSSRVVSITPKLVRARLSKLCSKAWSHTQQKRVSNYVHCILNILNNTTGLHNMT